MSIKKCVNTHSIALNENNIAQDVKQDNSLSTKKGLRTSLQDLGNNINQNLNFNKKLMIFVVLMLLLITGYVNHLEHLINKKQNIVVDNVNIAKYADTQNKQLQTIMSQQKLFLKNQYKLMELMKNNAILVSQVINKTSSKFKSINDNLVDLNKTIVTMDNTIHNSHKMIYAKIERDVELSLKNNIRINLMLRAIQSNSKNNLEHTKTNLTHSYQNILQNLDKK